MFRFINRLYRLILKIRLAVSSPVILSTQVFGYTILFVISSWKEYTHRFLASYTAERVTIEWIRKYIHKGDIIWDVGANVGAYALLMGKMMEAYGSGKVLAFEPESANFAALNKNIVINSLGEYITAIPIAFGNSLELGSFFLSSNEAGSATHALYSPVSDGISFNSTHIQGVLAISPDEFAGLANVPFPNHIKIDVDGLESVLVANMSSILSDSRLKTLVIEIADGLSNGVIEQMIESFGFKLVDEEQWDQKSGKIKNCLFSRSPCL
jgi:FkbM family methyltransferase